MIPVSQTYFLLLGNVHRSSTDVIDELISIVSQVLQANLPFS